MVPKPSAKEFNGRGIYAAIHTRTCQRNSLETVPGGQPWTICWLPELWGLKAWSWFIWMCLQFLKCFWALFPGFISLVPLHDVPFLPPKDISVRRTRWSSFGCEPETHTNTENIWEYSSSELPSAQTWRSLSLSRGRVKILPPRGGSETATSPNITKMMSQLSHICPAEGCWLLASPGPIAWRPAPPSTPHSVVPEPCSEDVNFHLLCLDIAWLWHIKEQQTEP